MLVGVALGAVATFVVLAILGSSGGPSDKAIRPTSAPFTIHFPTNFRTSGVKVDFKPPPPDGNYVALDRENFLAFGQASPAQELSALKGRGVALTERHERHSGLGITVLDFAVMYGSVSQHEQDNYFTANGQDWYIGCIYADKAKAIRSACKKAVNSISVR